MATARRTTTFVKKPMTQWSSWDEVDSAVWWEPTKSGDKEGLNDYHDSVRGSGSVANWFVTDKWFVRVYRSDDEWDGWYYGGPFDTKAAAEEWWTRAKGSYWVRSKSKRSMQRRKQPKKKNPRTTIANHIKGL